MEINEFQTVVTIPEFGFSTGYQKKNMFFGSCFTENIGKTMAELKYDTDINPFGIQYNPASIANSLRFLLEGKTFGKGDLFEQNGLWHSFFHHSKFSGKTASETLEEINRRMDFSVGYLKKCDFLFITFGTAWVFKFLKTGNIVSNCHKIPASQFERFRLTVDEIVTGYSEIIFKIKAINPAIKFVFTVSPIRHRSDGAIENQRSKATLILAIDRLIHLFGTEFCAYFPSYEIVMDELRDYRFYAEDMYHISEQGVKIIWQKFENSLISPESKTISEEIKKLNSALKHRPFNTDSENFQRFTADILAQIRNFEARYPYINLSLSEFKSKS